MITPVTAAARDEGVELELLHGAVFDADVWKLAFDAGLRDEHLATMRSKRFFRALLDYYSTEAEPPRDTSVLVARGLARDDVHGLTVAAGNRGAAKLAQAIIELAAERSRLEKVGQARAALADGDAERARQLLSSAQRDSTPAIAWVGAAEIFAPLPPTPWKVRGLHIAPGRPTLVIAYGASAKTLSLQSLGLSCAAGAPVWAKHHTTAMQVRHFDFEQGFHASAKRYQRLAIGHGVNPDDLDNRLQLCVFPRVFLDSPNAADVYARACDGADIVILDALRGAAPNQDENDSAIRACIDNLTLVSERTGAAFVLIHHAGKPKDGHSDARTVARGSSAIFDACGCVLQIEPGRTSTAPRKVRQTKQPADAEGGAIDDFLLAIEDVAIGADATAGVRVVHRPIETRDPGAESDAAFDRDVERVLGAVREHPDQKQGVIRERVRLNNQRVAACLDHLVQHGQVIALPHTGKGGGKVWRSI